MGQTQSKEGTDNLSAQDKEDIKSVQRLADSGGQKAVSKFIDEKLNKWKKAKINLAIAGRNGTGKTTFINKIRNLKPGDDCFAKTGAGNMTLQPTLYLHPRNDQLVLYDLPGFATLKFKKTDYIRDMKISDYDFVIIFFDKALCEDVLWFTGELRKMGKPFALVRSKIDDDIANAIEDDKDPKKIIQEIKASIEIDLISKPELKSKEGVFLISSRNPDLGDWSELMVFLEVNIDEIKAESLLFTLHCNTKEMLDRKYKMLMKRLVVATALAAGVAAIPLLGFNVAITIAVLVLEVYLFMRVFGIGPESVNTLTNFNLSLLKCKSLFEPNANITDFVLSKIKILIELLSETSDLDAIIPLIGTVISSCSSARVSYKFLYDTLQDIKDDAMLIYEHILTTNAD